MMMVEADRRPTEGVDRNSRELVHIMDLFIIAHFAGIGGSTQVENGCSVITPITYRHMIVLIVA